MPVFTSTANREKSVTLTLLKSLNLKESIVTVGAYYGVESADLITENRGKLF